MDWNDLKFFLAVAQARSLSAAAVQLGVSPSTVSRRIAALEGALRLRLFRAHRDGYDLTQAGHDLLPAAERAAAQLRVFARGAGDGSGDPAGPVRVDAPELLGQEVLLPAATRFMDDHPGVRVELRSSVLPVRLSAAEADIVLRLIRPGGGSYRMRKIGEIGFGLYASAEHAEHGGVPGRAEDLHRHRVIGWTEDLRFLTMARWLEEICPGVQPRLRLMSMGAQLSAVRGGAGWAVLPDFAAIPAGLVPGLTRLPRLTSDLWLLTHEQSRALPRVRLLRDRLVEALHGSLHGEAKPG